MMPARQSVKQATMAFSLKDFSDVQKVGEGGMGSVYVATQLSLNRKVIIKELSSNLHKDAKLITMFENEAKSAASLDHDNIIRVYDFGADNGSFFISMEYVDGPDLQQLMHWQMFVPEIGLMVLLQAAKGVAYAHRHNTMHCDLKPNNILISKAGKAKVLDFGLARAISHAADDRDSSNVFITPGYMAPEVALGNRELDPKVDIWSMGVLAYRILSGKLPFVFEDMRAVIYAIVHTKEQDLRLLAPAVRDDIAEAVGACLHKDPKTRPASLEPLIEVLENYFFELGIRDIGKELEKFISDKKTASADLYNNLAGYHLLKGNEFLASGNVARSNIHFREAEKFGFRDLQPGKTKGIVVPASGLAKSAPHPMAERATSGRWPAVLSGKSRVFKTAMVVAGVVSLLVLAVAPVIMFSQKPRAGEPDNTSAKTLTHSEFRAAAPVAVQQPPAVPDTDKDLAARYAVVKRRLTAVTPSVPDPAKPLLHNAAQKAPAANRRAPETQTAIAKYGVLKLQVEPPQASVFLDGKRAQLAELTQGKSLAAGPHAIYAVADGYAAYSSSVVIQAHASEILSIALKQLEKGVGMLHVHSYPWADIYVDDAFLGTAPTPKPITLAEGDHVLVLKREGFKDHTETVHVARGEVTRVKVQLEQ
jgi:serine/threonine protein kinase